MNDAAVTILFTAFEPSGDHHAAGVIAALLQKHPDWQIYGFGGPAMEKAGAKIIEQTTAKPAMILGAFAQIAYHWKLRRRITRWLATHHVDVLVPTDSPAANWGICAAFRRLHPDRAIVHMVAPQLWAWGRWRVKKLRRLTDHVCCILPFEPGWLRQFQIPASFVGHPIHDRADAQEHTASWPWADSVHRLLLLPGSREAEVRSNWPIMKQAAERLTQQCDDLSIGVCAANDKARSIIEADWPAEAPWQPITDELQPALQWSTTVLCVSGTVTLQVVRARKPMLIMYRVNRWTWSLIGRWLIFTRTFTLPNLVDQDGPSAHPPEHRIPELIPMFGEVKPVVETVRQVMTDTAYRNRQLEAMDRINTRFAGHHCGTGAVKIIEKYVSPTR